MFIIVVAVMIVITLMRIDRWTKYYFGPRVGQTQAEGKNHTCQGGLFKASPHYTVSSKVTCPLNSGFAAIKKNPKFNQTEKEESKGFWTKTHQRNSIHWTRLHIVKGTARIKSYWPWSFSCMNEGSLEYAPHEQESFDFFDDYTSTVKTTQNHTESSDLL